MHHTGGQPLVSATTTASPPAAVVSQLHLPLFGMARDVPPAPVAARTVPSLALADLDVRVDELARGALAPNSKRSASTAERNFQRFCALYNVRLHPVTGLSDEDMARYVAWITADGSVASASTVQTYLSMGVRRVHLSMGLPWKPLKERPLVAAVLKGTRRALKATTGTAQKLPITVEMLHSFRQHINLGNSEQLCVWTALLVGFYALLRKANLAAPNAGKRPKAAATASCAAGVLVRSDVCIREDGRWWLVLSDTKTIQLGERTLRLPLPVISGSPLCPTAALRLFMAATAYRPPVSQLFGWTDAAGCWHPLTHSVLVAHIKALVRAVGLDPARYSGHSLRRGGATFAFSRAHLDPLLIKALGDWLSNAFMRYCEAQEGMRLAGADAMAAATLASAPAHAAARPPPPFGRLLRRALQLRSLLCPRSWQAYQLPSA